MIRSSVISIAIFSLSMCASAKEPYSDRFSACIKDSGGVTVSMVNCIAEELEKQDARLNSVYKQFSASLTAERKKDLVEAQRLWIQYRDANCKFYVDPEGGTAELLAGNECLLWQTTERANELQRFLN